MSFINGSTPGESRCVGIKFVFLALLASSAFLAHSPELRTWFVALMLAATGIQYYLYRKAEWGLVEVVAGAVLLRVLFLPLPPIFSDDIFRYLWDGWLVLDGTNPFLHTPAEWVASNRRPPVDFHLLNSVEFYSVYPPVAQLLFASGFFLSTAAEGFLGMKIVFASLEMMALILMAKMVSARQVMLYAWFPLVVLVTAGQAHTESALVLFLVTTIWAVRQNYPHAAHIALSLATWTKLYPILLFPWLFSRFRWRGAWIPLVLTILIWIPFFHINALANLWSSLKLYGSYFEFNAGIYYAISFVAEQMGIPDATQVIGWLLLGVLIPVLLQIYRIALPEWTFERFALWVLGAFLLCATTVHPWYFLGLITLVPFLRQPPAHWLWISALSLGTYLWYTHQIYASFVAAAWLGGGFIYAWRHPHLNNELLRWRARWKARQFERYISPQAHKTILDLGCAEGYVGEELAKRFEVSIALLDTTDMNQTELPHSVYGGESIPFEDGAFDVTILSYVLHHVERPEVVMREAVRVTSDEVLVLENPVESFLQKRVVEMIDRMANGFRNEHGADLEENLTMHSKAEWTTLFDRCGATVVDEHDTGFWWAPTTLFRLRPDRSGR